MWTWSTPLIRACHVHDARPKKDEYCIWITHARPQTYKRVYMRTHTHTKTYLVSITPGRQSMFQYKYRLTKQRVALPTTNSSHPVYRATRGRRTSGSDADINSIHVYLLSLLRSVASAGTWNGKRTETQQFSKTNRVARSGTTSDVAVPSQRGTSCVQERRQTSRCPASRELPSVGAWCGKGRWRWSSCWWYSAEESAPWTPRHRHQAGSSQLVSGTYLWLPMCVLLLRCQRISP